jgi:hypothetical protein
MVRAKDAMSLNAGDLWLTNREVLRLGAKDDAPAACESAMVT